MSIGTCAGSPQCGMILNLMMANFLSKFGFLKAAQSY